MAIPLLDYTPRSQNHRVAGFEIPGEENSGIFCTESSLYSLEIESLIQAAYRQIFNEQQMLSFNRKKVLESQLKNGQITVRDFIRALILSDSFRYRNVDVNNNYRLSQMCVQRILGRDVYNEQEKMSWSIVIATKGFGGFVDDLLNSDEYLDNFGVDTVPYQRRRILPQRIQGDLPIARMPRYGADHRDQLIAMGYFDPSAGVGYQPWKGPKWVSLFGKVVTYGGAGVLALGLLAIALAAFEIISL
jgi:phycobilisome rod-core linker protein